MSNPIANSTNQFQLTIVQDGVRVTDAAITLTIIAPDGITMMLNSVSVPHIANGVYSLKTGPAVIPKSGNNYQAKFNISHGADEYNPVYYFNVYES